MAGMNNQSENIYPECAKCGCRNLDNLKIFCGGCTVDIRNELNKQKREWNVIEKDLIKIIYSQ